MAGEVFVARQDTLESVKGTVEDIDTNLGTPDYAGGGTDVVAMIGALASAVTTLQSDIDSVKTAIAGMGGSEFVRPEVGLINHTNKGSANYTISRDALAIITCHDQSSFLLAGTYNNYGDLYIIKSGTVLKCYNEYNDRYVKAVLLYF